MRTATFTAAIAVSLCGCAQDAGIGPSSEFELVGTVVDDRSGAGIEFAEINFSSDALDEAETTADAKGHFEFQVRVREGVEFGVISAQHEDYEPSSAQTIYFDGSTHVITLRLRVKRSTK